MGLQKQKMVDTYIHINENANVTKNVYSISTIFFYIEFYSKIFIAEKFLQKLHNLINFIKKKKQKKKKTKKKQKNIL